MSKLSLESVFTDIVNAEHTLVADVKEVFVKAKPVITVIATDTTDILNGTAPPPTGNATLDKILKLMANIAPDFVAAGLKTQFIAEIQNLLTYITTIGTFFGV